MLSELEAISFCGLYFSRPYCRGFEGLTLCLTNLMTKDIEDVKVCLLCRHLFCSILDPGTVLKVLEPKGEDEVAVSSAKT